MSKFAEIMARDATNCIDELLRLISLLEDDVERLSSIVASRDADVEVLEEELSAYRIIQQKTGLDPEGIIDMVSTLQGTINAIKGSSVE